MGEQKKQNKNLQFKLKNCIGSEILKKKKIFFRKAILSKQLKPAVQSYFVASMLIYRYTHRHGEHLEAG